MDFHFFFLFQMRLKPTLTTPALRLRESGKTDRMERVMLNYSWGWLLLLLLLLSRSIVFSIVDLMEGKQKKKRKGKVRTCVSSSPIFSFLPPKYEFVCLFLLFLYTLLLLLLLLLYFICLLLLLFAWTTLERSFSPSWCYSSFFFGNRFVPSRSVE